MKKLMLFQVGNRQFGIDLPLIRSIQKSEEVSEFKDVHLYDLPVVLGEDSSSHDKDGKKVMLVGVRDHSLGLKVDRVEGVISAESDQIKPLPPIFSEPSLSCFPQVLRQNNTLILLVNPEGIENLEQIKKDAEELERKKREITEGLGQEITEGLGQKDQYPEHLPSDEIREYESAEADDLEEIGADIDVESEPDMFPSAYDLVTPADDPDVITDVESEPDMFSSAYDLVTPADDPDDVSTDIDVESEPDMFSFEDDLVALTKADDPEDLSADTDVEDDLLALTKADGPEDLRADTDVEDDLLALTKEDDPEDLSADTDVEDGLLALTEADDPEDVSADTDVKSEPDMFSFENDMVALTEADDLEDVSADIDFKSEPDMFSFEDDLVTPDIFSLEREPVSPEEEGRKQETKGRGQETGGRRQETKLQPVLAKPAKTVEPSQTTEQAASEWPFSIAGLADDPEKLESALTCMIKEDKMSKMIAQSVTRLVEETVAKKIKKVKKYYQKGLYRGK